MIIGHLPAGFLIGRTLSRLQFLADARVRTVVGATMLGSIFPDTDIIYLYLIDHGRTHHHLYWTHLPAFWLVLCAAIFAAGAARERFRPPVAFWCFCAGVLSHLLLDSLIGDIYWLLPLSNQPFSLFSVQPRHTPWFLNFILHWVFALELVLAAAAFGLAVLDIRRQRARGGHSYPGQLRLYTTRR